MDGVVFGREAELAEIEAMLNLLFESLAAYRPSLARCVAPSVDP